MMCMTVLKNAFNTMVQTSYSEIACVVAWSPSHVCDTGVLAWTSQSSMQ